MSTRLDAGLRAGRRWGPAAGVMTAIFWASSLSSPPMPSALPDVGVHALAYAALGAAMLWGIAGSWRGSTSGRAMGLAVLLAVAFGVTDELHQSFVPGRTPELRDLVADVCGASAGAVAVWACGIVLAEREP